MNKTIRGSNQLGNAIRLARRERDYTQAELAKKTGLNQPTISSIENGEGGQTESVFKILRALQKEFVLTDSEQPSDDWRPAVIREH